MRQLALFVPILLLLGVGITSGVAFAELTADQRVQPPTANVGETAMVMLTLIYSGNGTDVTVTPYPPLGVVAGAPPNPGVLPSGSQQVISFSYPIRAEMSGDYLITSRIFYENYELWKESPFKAIGGPTSEPVRPEGTVLPEVNQSMQPNGTIMLSGNKTPEAPDTTAL